MKDQNQTNRTDSQSQTPSKDVGADAARNKDLDKNKAAQDPKRPASSDRSDRT